MGEKGWFMRQYENVIRVKDEEISKLKQDVAGLERFRDLRERHNREMERKQSAIAQSVLLLKDGDVDRALALLEAAQ